MHSEVEMAEAEGKYGTLCTSEAELRDGQGRAARDLTSRLGSPVSGSPSLTAPRPSSSSSLLTQGQGEK